MIQGCINGNRKCQEFLYKKFYGKMLGVCMRYSKDREEAVDILQDGFIKVFAKIKQYEGEGSFEGWVRRVISNTALDNIRKHRSSIQHLTTPLIHIDGEEIAEVDSQDEGDISDEIEEEEYSDISKEEILAAVQQLSPSHRVVFNMHIIEGVSHSEISEQLGINIGTSKSNLFKAKASLRKKLLKQQFVIA